MEEKHILLATDVFNYVKKHINMPLEYTEIDESGIKVVNNTTKGDEIYNKILELIKKNI